MAQWHLTGQVITWSAETGGPLPDAASIEMSGRRVSMMVGYGPELLWWRVFWPAWHTGHGPQEVLQLMLKEQLWIQRGKGDPAPPRGIVGLRFDGVFCVRYATVDGLEVKVELYPSPMDSAVFGHYFLHNSTGDTMRLQLHLPVAEDMTVATLEGEVNRRVVLIRDGKTVALPHALELKPNTTEQVTLAVVVTTKPRELDPLAQLDWRRQEVERMRSTLCFDLPDRSLLFASELAKVRTLESIFETSLGPLHSPGGDGFYYGSVFANDQVEYAFPLFPYLGQDLSAALHGYQVMVDAMKEDGDMPHSVEAAGLFLGSHDRADEAMFAYGCSTFLLGLGSSREAEKFLPAIEKTLEYEFARLDRRGIVVSASDELEGRFPTGDAPLASSALTYGALIEAARLETLMGRDQMAEEYLSTAARLGKAMDEHFGAEVEGFPTYRYFTDCQVLRGWICYPAAMGWRTRVEGTARALLSPQLWTDEGLRVASDSDVVWDRETLYALRMLFQCGYRDQAGERLSALVERRLLGNYPPYMAEVAPNGAQIAAESSLLLRVLTEGLFGLDADWDGVYVCPQLPANWDYAVLDRLRLSGHQLRFQLERRGRNLVLQAQVDERQSEYEFAADTPPKVRVEW